MNKDTYLFLHRLENTGCLWCSYLHVKGIIHVGVRECLDVPFMPHTIFPMKIYCKILSILPHFFCMVATETEAYVI